MKKIVFFTYSSYKLIESIKTPTYLATKLGLKVEIFLVVESNNTAEHFTSISKMQGADVVQYQLFLDNKLKDEQEKMKTFFDKNTAILEKVNVTYDVVIGNMDHLIGIHSKNKETQLVIAHENQERDDKSIFHFFDKFSPVAHCPIIRLPLNHKYNDFTKILYATDHKEEDIETLEKLSELAVSLNATITALHVTNSIELKEKLKSRGLAAITSDRIDNINIKSIVYLASDIPKGVNEYAQKNGFDLIVVLKKDKGFFKTIFKKSHSLEITTESELPVLIFHEENLSN